HIVGPWTPIDSQYLAKAVRAALLAECEDWDTTHRVNEVIAALKEKLADPANDEMFDIGENPNLEVICVKNGLVDWKTGTLYPWDPESYITTQLDVVYDPKAECPTWLEALEAWIPRKDTRDYIQEFIGLCMLPDTSFRTAVFLYGHGSNGKSLFIDGITMMFGNTASFIPLHRLAERFDTALLQNKLINICSDIDPQYLKETGTVKAIIAGDKIRGEYKHGKTFHFTPVARLLFSANELPKARDRSEGWYSRWGFVEFPNHFERNSSYKRKLITQLALEKSGTFNWALVGLQRLMKDNTFTESKTMKEAKYEYILENDNILSFLEERVEYGPHITSSIPKAQLYAFYKMFCEENGYRIASSREFTKQLKKLGIQSGSRPVPGNYKARTNSYIGVKIHPSYERDFNFMVSCRAHDC
ncbi:MAG TPA: phage/plasmid primase, P4 family, partial [Bacillota bacterium]|nr:phage/plasmid primase, P4 family [Bacillota bacterium]